MSIDVKQSIKKDWEGAPYYDLVECDDAMNYFWGDGRFVRLFDQLNLERVCELACGHGRHANHVLNAYQVGSVVLVDINQSNIDFCQNRFFGRANVEYLVNSGSDLNGLSDGSISALFSYDAMVHFEYDDVSSYLKEIRRVLIPGGKALLHHSNNDQQPGNLYSQNIHWRNFMSVNLFHHMAIRAGLNVLEQEVIDWGDEKGLDCISLLEKAA